MAAGREHHDHDRPTFGIRATANASSPNPEARLIVIGARASNGWKPSRGRDP